MRAPRKLLNILSARKYLKDYIIFLIKAKFSSSIFKHKKKPLCFKRLLTNFFADPQGQVPAIAGGLCDNTRVLNAAIVYDIAASSNFEPDCQVQRASVMPIPTCRELISGVHYIYDKYHKKSPA